MRPARGLATAVLLVLSACDGPASRSDEPVAPERTAEPMSHDLGPFFHAETDMNDQMRAAVGSGAADTWVRMMIEHHKGEVVMTQIMLELQPTSRAAGLARNMIDRRASEIDALEGLLTSGSPDYETARIYEPSIGRMHDSMMSVQATNPSLRWTLKMVRHHGGAVAMTDVLLKRDDVPNEIRRAAESISQAQIDDIRPLRKLLPPSEPPT